MFIISNGSSSNPLKFIKFVEENKTIIKKIFFSIASFESQ